MQTKHGITTPGRKLYDALRDSLSNDYRDGLYTERLRICSQIARAAKTYHRRQEEACSYEWACGDKWDRDEARLEKRIAALVAELGEGFGVVLEGDPRGACVFITTPDKRTDDWGQRGICALQD